MSDCIEVKVFFILNYTVIFFFVWFLLFFAVIFVIPINATNEHLFE